MGQATAPSKQVVDVLERWRGRVARCCSMRNQCVLAPTLIMPPLSPVAMREFVPSSASAWTVSPWGRQEASQQSQHLIQCTARCTARGSGRGCTRTHPTSTCLKTGMASSP